MCRVPRAHARQFYMRTNAEKRLVPSLIIDENYREKVDEQNADATTISL